ncbi:MAG: methyltransferase [Alphaproteobacteria bacterium]|nr:methyltransferase [Alphaproteobacteria bacterium]
MTDPVHLQYETLPYPPRDPRDEAKRLITGSPSRLAELDHFVFGGERDFRRPFRALVAGGGTGDAAIMLGQQLADASAREAEVVYLDWSTASRKVAEARAAARGLRNLRFVTDSLLETASLGLGRFDYIDCCGVLHHLPDPAVGLKALVSLLAENGGMGLMLYGRLGRTGVYPTQAMLQALVREADDPAARLALAKKLLAQLPATNWLKRNPFVTDHIVEGDPGIFDLLLHARDRAYDVLEIDEFVRQAGLRLVSFVPPARYEPASYLSDAALLRRLDGTSMLERAAFAENLAGNIKSHVFYVVRSTNPVAAPQPGRDTVPVYSEAGMATTARAFKPGDTLKASVDGWTAKLPLPPLTPAIAELIDGQRSLADIHGLIAERRPDLSWDDFAAQFRLYYAAFHGVGHLMLKLPAEGA